MAEEKVKRSQFRTFLKTGVDTWALLGKGVTEYGIAFNPQNETEKYITDDNATTTHTSNQKQGDVSQKAYKGNAVYDYINGLRDKINVETEALDVDTYLGVGDVFPAKKSKVLITVNNYMGAEAVIEYSIYYNGDPEEGTVTLTNGVPTFTKGGSI